MSSQTTNARRRLIRQGGGAAGGGPAVGPHCELSRSVLENACNLCTGGLVSYWQARCFANQRAARAIMGRNLAPSAGPVRWPRPLAPSAGPVRWPRPLAPSAGPVRWPRPLAKSAAEIIGKTWRCAPCQGVFCNCDAELTGPVGQPLAQPRIAAYSVGSVPIREMINAGLTALHSRFGNRKHAWQCGTMRRRRARAGRRRFYHSSLQDPGRSIINPLVRRRSG
jgi:hypothetical protein